MKEWPGMALRDGKRQHSVTVLLNDDERAEIEAIALREQRALSTVVRMLAMRSIDHDTATATRAKTRRLRQA